MKLPLEEGVWRADGAVEADVAWLSRAGNVTGCGRLDTAWEHSASVAIQIQMQTKCPYMVLPFYDH